MRDVFRTRASKYAVMIPLARLVGVLQIHAGTDVLIPSQASVLMHFLDRR